MSDFETHVRGTATEIRLSRELVKEMDQIMTQFGRGIFPESVLAAYDRLSAHHSLQLASEGL